MVPEVSSKTKKSAVFDQRYEILSTIGRGRNSIVYRARLLSLNGPRKAKDSLPVALKVLTGSPKQPEQNISRLKREALAMLSARHPHVIRMSDYVTTGDLCYLTMELAELGDLKRELEKRESPFPPEQSLQMILDVLCGLEAIHHAGIIHRDVKPENLLLTQDGKLKIGDFGIARLPLENIPLEELSRGVGTLEYLAPEALEKNIINEATDVYSVGVTLYQLLTKKLPFGEDTLSEQIKKKVAGRYVPLAAHLADVPPELETLLERAIAANPEKRFKSAKEFREAINAYLHPPALDPVLEKRPTPPAPRQTSKQTPIQSIARETAKATESAPAGELARETARDYASDLAREFQSESTGDLAGDLAPELEDKKISAKLLPIKTIMRRRLQALSQIPLSLKLGRLQSLKEKLPEQLPLPSRQGKLLFAVFAVIIMGWMTSSLFEQSKEISGLGSIPSDGLGTLDRILGAQEFKAEEVQGATYIPSGDHVGVLYNFNDSGHATFHVSRAKDKNQLLFTLGIIGWTSPIIDLGQIENNGTLTIGSGGIVLLLEPTTETSIAGVSANGRYTELLSGKTGDWVLW